MAGFTDNLTEAIRSFDENRVPVYLAHSRRDIFEQACSVHATEHAVDHLVDRKLRGRQRHLQVSVGGNGGARNASRVIPVVPVLDTRSSSSPRK